MRRRRGDTTKGRERLLSFWEPPDDAGGPIGCVATTFTFDAAFFEEQCLARFAGVEGDPLEDTRAYLIEREEKLSQVFTCVLVDHHNVAATRSLRWNLLPIRPTGHGILHAKVSLLVWERWIRVLVASANLTEPAYRRNYEVAGMLEFHAESNVPRALLLEILDFLRELRALIPGAAFAERLGPIAGLDQFLERVRDRALRLPDGAFLPGQPRAHFVPIRPGGADLFARVKQLFPRTGPDVARVVSPFYDDGDGSRRVVDHLIECMAVHGQRTVKFTASGREHAPPARTVELDLPSCLRQPWKARTVHEFSWVPLTTENGEQRPLHAKTLWFGREERALFVLGSSNFTAAGIGLSGSHANIEANLAYALPDIEDAFAQACRGIMPPNEDVDPAKRCVIFQEAGTRTEEAAPTHLLPVAFGLALFHPDGAKGLLELEIGDGAPGSFTVQSESGIRVLDDDAWRAEGSPRLWKGPWPEIRPPSHLQVQWTDDARGACIAIWVVNVGDGSRLPPPDELRNLDLDELLAVLTSAKPLHEAVSVVIQRREAIHARRTATSDLIDPHRRVDTRNHLIRRMRRVAAALEGLRERLERPAYSLDALRWRLHGPVGPLALAERLIEKEPTAAAFFVAEVFLTLRRLDRSRLNTHLDPRGVDEEMRRVSGSLRLLVAAARPVQRNLKTYVDNAFDGAPE